MSHAVDHVVDLQATIEEAPALSERVVTNLLSRGIILPTPQTHEYLTGGPRYASGPNIGKVADFNDCFRCGLGVKIGRGVYDAGENGLQSFTCPNCEHSHKPDDLEWASAIGEWFHGKRGILKCRNCGDKSPVIDWRISPVWGFGNLAFSFSEWLLKEEFVRELSQLLGHRVAWVRAHY